MSGSHYRLTRDLINPMDQVKEKPCKRCTIVKPNTYKYFGKKRWRTTTETTTVDVCLKCMGTRMSEVHAERRAADKAYEEYKIQETIRKFKQGEAERVAKAASSVPEKVEGSDTTIEDRIDSDQGRKESDPG